MATHESPVRPLHGAFRLLLLAIDVAVAVALAGLVVAPRAELLIRQ